MSKNIQIIRALWGWEREKLSSEIPTKPIFENEVVYVWGEYQHKYLLNLGYNCIYVGDEVSNYPFNHLTHKVESFDLAFKDFENFLYVDWDVKIVKPLDEKFWKSFENQLFSSSLYPFHKNFLLQDYDWPTAWHHLFKMNVKYYDLGWKLEESLILPNCGLTYFSKESYDLYMFSRKKYPYLMALPDEFLLYLMSECDLDTYLTCYTNTVMFGKNGEDFPNQNKDFIQLCKWFNSYVEDKLNMDIYLEHV